MFDREKKFTLTVYSDPSHSWAKVRREVLKNLGVDKDISNCSYQRGDYVYLEEDCDLGVLCRALLKNNTLVVFREKTTDKPSRVRTYESYRVA